MLIIGMLRLRVVTIGETQKTSIRALIFGQRGTSQYAASHMLIFLSKISFSPLHLTVSNNHQYIPVYSNSDQGGCQWAKEIRAPHHE